MKIVKQLIPKTRYWIKSPYEMNPTRVVIHNTANDATARNEGAYMVRNNNYVSFHWAVDNMEAVQFIPHNRNAWCSGDGTYGKGNREGIHIEICYSKSGGAKFAQAEKNGATLAAMILLENKWKTDRLTKHQDYNGKYCPHRTLDLGWKRFVNLVEAEMRRLQAPSIPKTTSNLTNEKLARQVIAGQWGNNPHRREALTKAGYDYEKVQALVDLYMRGGNASVGQWVKVQGTHYATGQKIPAWVRKGVHKVSQIVGNKALLGANGGINSWVYVKDIKVA